MDIPLVRSERSTQQNCAWLPSNIYALFNLPSLLHEKRKLFFRDDESGLEIRIKYVLRSCERIRKKIAREERNNGN